MPELIIWKDEEINKLKKDMNRLMFRLREDFIPSAGRKMPFIDLVETEDTLILKTALPGFKPDDLNISITNDVLTIKGETKQDFVKKSEDYHKKETIHGSISRTVRLPCRIRAEDVEATCKEDVLTIVMPKCKPEKTHEVKIKTK